MKSHVFFLVALGAVGCFAMAKAIFGADDRTPIRLIAEAEDFTVKVDGWQVVPFRENYFASTFAISFLSRMGCLGAPEQLPANETAVAEQVVQIPYADQFEVLVRYEQPYNFSVEFTIEIEQNGRVVDRRPCGRLTDPKIWAFNGHERVPMVRHWWGGTDNIVWQHPGSVRLAAGAATIRLVATSQQDGTKQRMNAARRNVDVVVLTNDRAGMEAQKKARYLEFDGWLVQDGDLFVRFTNPPNGLGPCAPVVAPYAGGQHSPYYIHVRDWPTTTVLRSGRLVSPTPYKIEGPRSRATNASILPRQLDAAKYVDTEARVRPNQPPPIAVPEDEYLQPGQSSGWVPLGPVLDTLHNCQWYPQALYADRKVKDVHLALEFAIPDGRGGLKPIKTITVKGTPGSYSPVTFEMPGNIVPNPTMTEVLAERYWLPQIRTQKEALDWLNAEVAKFPRKGTAPKRFLLYHILGFSRALEHFPEAQRLARALGDNTAVGQQGKKRELVAHWRDPAIDAIKKRETARPDGFKDLHIVSYGDEIHLPSDPVTDEEFAAWLRSRGVKFNGPVKFVSVKRGDPPQAVAAARAQPLYYYSQICAKEKGGRRFAQGTAYYAGKGVLTGANYAPHANYLINEMDYVRPFKIKAMSMPWSEDYVWQIPEFSVQVTGYLTSGLRAGAKYHNMPIHMYVMPHSPGNTPRDFRLSFYTAVAHGAKMVNYFCASPLAVGTTENYIATEDLAMWRQVHACSHEAGIFEDYVMDGKVRTAKVGVLLSSVDDVMTGSTNSTLAMHNNERKAIYYALRHSQVPVDFLSEDDVIDGLAKDYRLIYVTQQWMHSKAMAALAKWVEGGGTALALCGGGFLDEFNRPSTQAGEFYGVKNQQLETDPQLVSKYLLEENRPFLTKQDLPLYEPMDYVTWNLEEFTPPSVFDYRGAKRIKDVPVIVWKQRLEVGDGRVLGVFKDGKPAVITKSHGEGHVYLFGFLPGQAYLRSGLPILPADRGSTDAAFGHFLPTAMDVSLRMRIVDDFLPGGVIDDLATTGTAQSSSIGRTPKRWGTDVRPVECSESLVETSVIDTPAQSGKPARMAVPLMNFTGQPIQHLVVRVNDLPKATSIRSVERGRLRPTFAGDIMTIELPLDVADMLLIDR